VKRLAVSLVGGLVLAGAAVAASPHDPQKRFTKADQAWARKLLVKRGDLAGAGWRSQVSSNDATCQSFNPDESDLVETGERESPEFNRNGSFVASMAAVFRSSAHAQSAWNREIKLQVLDCLAEGIKDGSTDQVQVRIASRSRLAVPSVAPRTAGFRVKLAFDVQGVKFGSDVHLIALGRGRANVMLMTMSSGRPLSPLPAGLERTLVHRLAQRLRG
jgi:opacity protein-like surface antigen